MANSSEVDPAAKGDMKPHWYDDGDVIIEVHETNECSTPVQFRVHKRMMASHSEFFSNMFREGTNWVENHQSGQPADVVIKHESITRFVSFLDWIYENQGRSVDLNALEEILIAADRYLCPGIRNTAGNIASIYPDSFDLLRIAFERRLGAQLCMRLISWAIQNPDTKYRL